VLLAILLGVLLVVVFDVFCLLHLGKADTAHFLPKFVWAVLIMCISPIGGLAYLLAQRLPKRSPEPPAKPVNRGIGVASIILSCSSSDYGWGLSQPHTPTRSLLYRSPARPGPYGHSSRGCACSYEVARVRGRPGMVRADIGVNSRGSWTAATCEASDDRLAEGRREISVQLAKGHGGIKAGRGRHTPSFP